MNRTDGQSILDPQDLEIIRLLRHDGRISNTEIGRRLYLSEAAVRKRVNRLMREGFIKVVAVANPRKLGFATVVVIGLGVDLAQLQSVSRRVARLPEVQYVAHSMGAFDILIEVWLASNEDLHSFVTEKLAQIPGVRRTEAAFIPKVVKSNYEFIEEEGGEGDEPDETVAAASLALDRTG